MIDYQKWENNPDYHRIIDVANNKWVDKVPLYEHLIGAKVIKDIMGTEPFEQMFSKDDKESVEAFSQYFDFWREMGYDTASYEFSSCGILVGAGALGGHKDGCIKTREDFEKYPWAEIPDRFFGEYSRIIRNLEEACPDDMRLIGGVGNGIFEAVQDIVGYMDLCYIKADDEELYRDIFKAMGEAQFKIWDRFMSEFSDKFCLLRFGDDLGFKSQTLISTDDINENIIPVYKKIIARVHKENKPFLLHSCGAIFDVMDNLISEAEINAKHSNEDQIAHFSKWVEMYGDKIGNFGGIDTDVLCRQSPSYIHDYVFDCLDRVKGKGGIAFSSGNSIPDYVPTEGYLAMVDAVREWRGDKKR